MQIRMAYNQRCCHLRSSSLSSRLHISFDFPMFESRCHLRAAKCIVVLRILQSQNLSATRRGSDFRPLLTALLRHAINQMGLKVRGQQTIKSIGSTRHPLYLSGMQ